MFTFYVNDKFYEIRYDDNRSQIFEKLNGIETTSVTKDYYTFKGEVFERQLESFIGLHFRGKYLFKIELFDDREVYETGNLIDRFIFKQKILESLYPEPIKYDSENIPILIDGNETFHVFNNAYWNLDNVRIEHYMMERFGPEEHLHFVKYNIGTPWKEIPWREKLPFLFFVLVFILICIGAFILAVNYQVIFGL